jgi:hypothetical protein
VWQRRISVLVTPETDVTEHTYAGRIIPQDDHHVSLAVRQPGRDVGQCCFWHLNFARFYEVVRLGSQQTLKPTCRTYFTPVLIYTSNFSTFPHFFNRSFLTQGGFKKDLPFLWQHGIIKG